MLVVLLVLSGLAEGFGVLTLLPLLEVVVEGRPTGGLAQRLVADAMGVVGLEGTVETFLLVPVLAVWLRGLLHWVAMRQMGYTVAQVARDLRLRLIRALVHARWQHYGMERSGDIAAALSRDAFWASYAYRHAVRALAAAVQLAAYAVVVVLISWRFGAMAIGAAAVLTGGLSVFIGLSAPARTEPGCLAHWSRVCWTWWAG